MYCTCFSVCIYMFHSLIIYVFLYIYIKWVLYIYIQLRCESSDGSAANSTVQTPAPRGITGKDGRCWLNLTKNTAPRHTLRSVPLGCGALGRGGRCKTGWGYRPGCVHPGAGPSLSLRGRLVLL